MANFGLEIATRRKRAGISLRQLGELTGMSSSYLSLIERGLMPPPADPKLELLGAALGLKSEEVYILAGRLPVEFRQFVRLNTASAMRVLRRLQKKELAQTR